MSKGRPSPADLLVLIGFIALCLAVGWLARTVTTPALADWYPTLAKPVWTPPNAVFPIAWTILYLLMGSAAWLVWRERRARDRRVALLLFFLQLALNIG